MGAGSAGTVLANRLTENPEWKVLLLEAGDEDSIISEIPIIVDEFQLTGYNWGYSMEKQDGVCLGMDDQYVVVDDTCFLSCLEALGGVLDSLGVAGGARGRGARSWAAPPPSTT